VLVGGRLTWQTYVPYLQGEAKKLLETFTAEAWQAGVRGTVFNAPEIWTNSSALFLGVEVSLYPLLLALRDAAAKAGTPAARAAADGVWERSRALLKPGATLEGLLERADKYLAAPELQPYRKLEDWPQHAGRAQMEAMLAASEETLAMSADPRNPVLAELSRVVFGAVGRLMLDEAWEPASPVRWVGHDVIAKRFVAP
jgi:hypothetical protein